MATTRQMGGLAIQAPSTLHFAPTSPWMKPPSDRTPYQHPTIPQANSRNWVVSLCKQMDLDPNTGLKIPGGQANKMGMGGNIPLYVVSSDQPRRPFGLDAAGLATAGGPVLDALLREGVPAPLDAGQGVSGVNDKWMNIYQPSTDTLWEGYGASSSIAGGPIDRFRWGGVIFGVSKHSGTYTTSYDPYPTRVTGHPSWSANATSISNVAGLVSIEELADCGARGIGLGHTLAMSLGHAQHTPIAQVWPARRADGDLYDRPDYIPEGARIIFPWDADFSKVRPEMLPIAKAIQSHGIIPTDKTGYGVTIHMRDYSITDSPQWPSMLTLYQQHPDAGSMYMAQLPWHQAIIVNPAVSR